MNTLEQALSAPYPGRGIIIGTTPAGHACFAYFIMGRSASSRARRFFNANGDVVIKNIGGDPEHPELIFYSPVRTFGGRVIVTNGDQTDTVFDGLRLGGSFESALRTREFEPDPPHFTSRISGLLEPCGAYALSILKASDGTGAHCLRQFFHYEAERGVARFIHTYSGTENGRLMPFMGEPVETELPELTAEELADSVWNALNEDNKVALCARVYGDGGFEEKMINKY